MGYFSRLSADVMDLRDDGYTVAEIATKLNLPFETVVEVIDTCEDCVYDDGQPDEAQEWESFDPDC